MEKLKCRYRMVYNIETRNNSTFITFDVVNFYPSINRDLMGKAIKFAQMCEHNIKGN